MKDNLLNRFLGIDERFFHHRYKSTRAAVLVGIIMMVVWTWIEYFVNDVLRWDLILILFAMAVVKVAVMLYYQLTD